MTSPTHVREESMDDMLRPPVNHAMRTLDRAFFRKTVPISAARIFSNQHIALCRKELEKSEELLRYERVNLVQPDPEGESGRKCLLLKPEVRHNGMV
jgi:tRNA (guanine37-N1)-methyltransferase